MELAGWDTHQGQLSALENNLSDIFGTGKGLDVLTQELAKLPGNLLADTVFVFTTDFGRQLTANGSAGTDHGRGNYMVLVGESVKGGIYGEMFPRSEISNLGNGETRYTQLGSDIEGKTSFERILAAACDWVEPGSGKEVFPNTAKNDLTTFPDGPILERDVDLNSLFSSI